MTEPNPWDEILPSSEKQSKTQKPKLQVALASRLKTNILEVGADKCDVKSRKTKVKTLPFSRTYSALSPHVLDDLKSPTFEERYVSRSSRSVCGLISSPMPSLDGTENSYALIDNCTFHSSEGCNKENFGAEFSGIFAFLYFTL